MRTETTWLIPAVAAAMVTAALAASAEAGDRSRYQESSQVVAHSRFGNGAVVGSVRQTRLGRQVRTPGGNWLYCARSCSETLRVNTVDFWQSEAGGGRNAIGQEDGLLSPWLSWGR